MPIAVGVDVGTTTITALALDTASGEVLTCCTVPNDAETTSLCDKARGRSEWDARLIAQKAGEVLRGASDTLGTRRAELVGLGVTGQQHGVVIVNEDLEPIAPFVNWQDRRGEEVIPNSEQTYVAQAVELAGPEAPPRTGCTLSSGFMGITLYWMKETGVLPSRGTACFVTDYVASVLTGERPVTDPTSGASSGLLDVTARDWDHQLIEALHLPAGLFPEVREAGDPLGSLSASAAQETGLPIALPVFVALGDNQASFVGSVANRRDTALVNVGTGGQVSAYSSRFCYSLSLETRPFPRGGYLLVHAGLCGGRSYAILQRLFRHVGSQLLGVEVEESLYTAMNELARNIPRGADGLRCEPFFAGSRSEPDRRATWTGVSETNFTPAHMTRALLEGMARAFCEGYEDITALCGMTHTQLVGAGNGLRENPVLAGIMEEEFGLPLAFPSHCEEAAYGAALTAAYGAGVYDGIEAASAIIRYVPSLHKPDGSTA